MCLLRLRLRWYVVWRVAEEFQSGLGTFIYRNSCAFNFSKRRRSPDDRRSHNVKIQNRGPEQEIPAVTCVRRSRGSGGESPWESRARKCRRLWRVHGSPMGGRPGRNRPTGLLPPLSLSLSIFADDEAYALHHGDASSTQTSPSLWLLPLADRREK